MNIVGDLFGSEDVPAASGESAGDEAGRGHLVHSMSESRSRRLKPQGKIVVEDRSRPEGRTVFWGQTKNYRKNIVSVVLSATDFES